MDRIFSKRTIHRIVLGSVLFGMFFGAGNLIFPIDIGQNAGIKLNIASIAFMITSILLPVLGVIFCARSKSSSLEELLSSFGKKYAIFFNTALLLTIGPLFALPRTATVPYEVGVKSLFPSMNHSVGLLIYSLLFFLVALLFALKPNKIKEAIGKYINPIFLVCLSIFFIAFFFNTMGPVSEVVPTASYQSDTFVTAFEVGYQTMDLLAALVFTYVVISVNDFEKETKSESSIKDLIFAGVFAGGLLIIIYYILVVIGASSRNIFELAPNGGIALGNIFNYYFGPIGTLFFVLTITLACLKTAIGLIIACSNYFSILIPKFSYTKFAIFFSIFGFTVSNVGLDLIIVYAVPVLNFLYPLAIMHVLYGLIFKNKNVILNKAVLYSTMIASILEVLKGMDSTNPLITSIVNMYMKLPLSNFGFAWVSFSCVGLIIGMIINIVVTRKIAYKQA